MNRFLIAVIAIMSVAAFSSGCGQSASPPPASEPELSGKSITVVTTYGPNDGGRPAYIELCDEFSEATGVSITDNSNDSTEEWKLSVMESYGNGSEPDVLFFFTGPNVQPLIDEGKFVSFDEIRGVFPDYASNINLSVLEGMKSPDGSGYAVPIKGYWERMFINTDIFESLGLTPPETYNDLLALSKPLLDAGYIPIAASLGEVPHYLFEAVIFNETGPTKHSDIPDDAENVPDAWITGLNRFKEMYDAGMFPPDTGTITHAEAFELFQAKKAAMILDGDWSAPYVRDAESTAVVNFPAIPGGFRKNTDLISGFSMGFYISRSAWDNPEKRDAAVAFVEFITSNDSIMRLNVSGAAMPISISGGGEGEEQEGVTALRRSIDALNMTTTAFVGAVADEMLPEARALLFESIPSLSKGEISAEELLKEFIAANSQQ